MPSINTELGERALSKMQHEMDWKPLKERCLRVYPTWSSRHVDRILREYQRFLALKVATRDIYDTIVLAPVLLDAMWKQHILSTQQYYADCQQLLHANQILHYNSDFTVNLSASVREKRMELTKASLCMMFSGMYPLSSDAKGIWQYEHREQGNNNNNNNMDGDAGTAGAGAGAGVIGPMGISIVSSSAPSSVANETDTQEGELTEDDGDLPLIGDSDGDKEEEEEEEEIQIQVETIPRQSKRPKSPKKNRSKSKMKTVKKAPPPPPPPSSEDSELARILLYIYRAGKVSKLHVYPHETIMAIKGKIERRTGLQPQEQYLEWEGLELQEKRSIEHYRIPSESTLVLSKISNLGGDHQHQHQHQQQQQQQHQQQQQQHQHRQHQQDIDTDILRRQDLLIADQHDDDDEVDGRGLIDQQRDEPEFRQKGHYGGNNNNPATSRRRSRPSPLPKSPRPPKPPPSRQQQQLLQQQQLHYPNSPLTATEDDSYDVLHVADNSPPPPPVVVQQHDPHRRRQQQQQQALLNKLKIQTHDQHRHGDLESDIDDNDPPPTVVPSRPRPKPSSSPPQLLKVFVNTIMGFTITLTTKASDTVDQLKQMIEDQEDIPSSKQILILDGVPLQDSQPLADYINDHNNDNSASATLHVLLRLQAGSSAVSRTASSLSPSSTMATVPRKKKSTNMLLVRATAGGVGGGGGSPRNNNGGGGGMQHAPKWR